MYHSIKSLLCIHAYKHGGDLNKQLQDYETVVDNSKNTKRTDAILTSPLTLLTSRLRRSYTLHQHSITIPEITNTVYYL